MMRVGQEGSRKDRVDAGMVIVEVEIEEVEALEMEVVHELKMEVVKMR